jgi:hypothetical protein
MDTSILSDDDGAEGMGQQVHLSKLEVLPYGLKITDKVPWSQERRVLGKLGAPATSLIIEDQHVAVGEWLEVWTDVIDACTRPTVDHDDCVIAGSDHLVGDLGTARTGQVALDVCQRC